MINQDDSSRKHFNTNVKTGSGADFEGCTTYPKRAGYSTKNKLTGDVHGICSRCGNYTAHLSDIGYCALCEDRFKNNNSSLREKTYIKAGRRSHVDL